MKPEQFAMLLHRNGVHNITARDELLWRIAQEKLRSWTLGFLVGATAALFIVWVFQAP